MSISVDILPTGTAAFNAATAALKLIMDLQEEANSPDMIKAAAAKKKLIDMDALVLAQKNNDLKAEQIAAENAAP